MNQPSDPTPDPLAGHAWRLETFPDLMPRRVEHILLVSSAYDAFMLEEDGLLSELIFAEYSDLGLSGAPRVTRVSSAEEALRFLAARGVDLVITMPRLGDMDAGALATAIRRVHPALPVVLLAADEAETALLSGDRDADALVDGAYVWQGDAKLFLAIIKSLEDRWNVVHDTAEGNVGVIILLEDSIHYRSTLLPMMYTELVRQTRRVMAEGLNRMQKLVRQRARPKILVAGTYEEGLDLFTRHCEHLFGVICDVAFPRAGQMEPQAGLAFIRHARAQIPDLAALLQSSDPDNRREAEALSVRFLHKHSKTLLADLITFMMENFGLGDFVFRMPNGREIGRATDLRSLAAWLERAPSAAIEYHARHNHFSTWLRARSEFALAAKLRPRRVSEFRDEVDLRRYLVEAFHDAVQRNRRGVIEDFSRQRFDARTRFARIGGGSLGGKARGLAFVDVLLARHGLERAFDPVRLFVPRTVVIATGAFDDFLTGSGLRADDIADVSDEWLLQRFLSASLPAEVMNDLRAFVEQARFPLAVRSSSLLEDSLSHPFAGVYATRMLPNAAEDAQTRLNNLASAIRVVYASTFARRARAYLESAPHLLATQRMAVIVQELVGRQHEHYFYPDFSGVCRSYNYYPFGHARPEDGVAEVALGLGKFVVDGHAGLRFCPRYPHVLPQLGLGARYLDQSQRSFYAVNLQHAASAGLDTDSSLAQLGLADAERHGTLAPVASVWSRDSNSFYDGIYRDGVRAITFAHILKSDLFPLAPILQRLLDLGHRGLGAAVEIEFAGCLGPQPQFAVLQIRPTAHRTSTVSVDLSAADSARLLCASDQALGHGSLDGLRDIVFVRPDGFDAARTRDIASDVARVNRTLRDAGRRYLLIGPGRWGTSNPWLGVPVSWADISGAAVVVEAGIEGYSVDPSQGSHFFHNLVAAGTVYLTVGALQESGAMDWAWLSRQPVASRSDFLTHVRLDHPLDVRVDGRRSRGVVLKPQ